MNRYYACLETKPDKNGKTKITKVPFENRDEARAYIRKNFNTKDYSSCWTE